MPLSKSTFVLTLLLSLPALADAPITAAALSPDGTQVVIGSQGGIEIRSWPELIPSKKLATQRALVELQHRFLVCKVDLTGWTRGTYSYVWDLAERFWPQAFVNAHQTSRATHGHGQRPDGGSGLGRSERFDDHDGGPMRGVGPTDDTA